MCHVSRLSRHMVFHISVLAQFRVFMSCVVMSHNCVLSVTVSGIAKCLFCVESLAFLAERRPLRPFTYLPVL